MKTEAKRIKFGHGMLCSWLYSLSSKVTSDSIGTLNGRLATFQKSANCYANGSSYLTAGEETGSLVHLKALLQMLGLLNLRERNTIDLAVHKAIAL